MTTAERYRNDILVYERDLLFCCLRPKKLVLPLSYSCNGFLNSYSSPTPRRENLFYYFLTSVSPTPNIFKSFTWLEITGLLCCVYTALLSPDAEKDVVKLFADSDFLSS